MPKARITKVVPISNGFPPCIVEFQNGELNYNNADNLHCETLENRRTKRKHISIVNNNILYTGELPDESDEDENVFLGVRNKRTNEITLYQTCRVMLKAEIPKKRDVLDSSVTENNTTILQLNKEFGSKKTKRYTEQMEKLKTNIDNVKQDLENTVANITVTDSDLVQQSNIESSWKPPINRDASRLEEVYKLNDFLTDTDLDNLSSETMKLLDDGCEELYTVPFVTNEIVNLRNSSNSPRSQLKSKILLYIDCIIKFFRHNSKEIVKKNYAACDFSPELSKKLLDSFTVLSSNGRSRPNTMRDKAICYIMVLIMLACDEVHLDVLAKEMKCGVAKLQEYGRILAFSSAENKSKLVLKLPLPAASSLNKFSKKKKK